MHLGLHARAATWRVRGTSDRPGRARYSELGTRTVLRYGIGRELDLRGAVGSVMGSVLSSVPVRYSEFCVDKVVTRTIIFDLSDESLS